MVQKSVQFRLRLPPAVNLDLKDWAETEGRSKQRNTEILLKRLTSLRRTNRVDLERLGLVAKEGAL